MDESKFISEKKEFIMVDYCKFIFCFLVIYIHIPALKNINQDLSFWIKEVLARIAVPFFFTSTGFFLGDEIKNKKRVFLYLEKISIMYIVYSVMYLPQQIYFFIESNYNLYHIILKLLRDFLFVGVYNHLWYFLAVIISVYLLYKLINILKMKKEYILVFAITLYLMGVIGFILKVEIKEIFMFSYYYNVFNTTRNGLFFGFLFILIGYLIRTSNLKTKPFMYFVICLVAFLFMTVEAYFIKNLELVNNLDMTLTLPIVCSCFFLTIVSIKQGHSARNYAILIRKLSALIFGLHMLIQFYITIFFKLIFNVTLDNLRLYIITSLLSLSFSYVIILLSKKEKLSFLRKLYS